MSNIADQSSSNTKVQVQKAGSIEKVEALFQNSRACENMLQIFSLFSNKYRFRILCVLNEGDFCVNEITSLVEGNISNISQQLKLLTLAGYIEKMRKQRLVYYHLAHDSIRDLLEFLQKRFGES